MQSKNETPRKVAESRDKCYLCSKSCQKNNRIFVFGKSSADISSLISSAIDVDLNKFSPSDDLFVCKNACYKVLLKFRNCLEKYEGIKKEIKAKYVSEGQVRTKRLRRTEEEAQLSNQVQRSRSADLLSPPGAAKSLQFLDSTTSTSSVNSGELCLAVPHEISKSTDSVLVNDPTVFTLVLPATQTSSSLPLLLTSTPVPSTKKAKGTVKITIHHPSKTVNKTLDNTYEALGKLLFYGPPSRVATAIMNCEPIRREVIKKVLGVVTKEVNGLCSTSNPSILRKCGGEDLKKFDLQTLCEEWAQRAPLFYSFLLTSACKSSTNVTWLPSVAVSGSVLLKQRHSHMNATATVLGILLKSRSIEANLARLTKMKVTCSNKTVHAKLNCLGENHDFGLKKAQGRIAKESLLVKEKESVLSALKAGHFGHLPCSENCMESILQAHSELQVLKESCHPGFVIAFDNIDMQLQRKSMTLLSQNRTYHWVNHKMVNNRVSGFALPGDGPKAELLDVPNIKFFPSIEDHQQQRLNYATLVSRVIVDYFDAFSFLKIVCVQHIPHKYVKEMSEKSSKVPLGVIFKNEIQNEDMLDVLKQFHSYLPTRPDGGYDPQLFAGDQVTVERAINVIASVANGYSPEDRLEGINLQLGDWHACVKLLTMIYNRFFSGKSEGDSCTLFSDRTLINRRNVTGDPKAAYRPNRDFLEIVLKSRIIAAAMKVLGLASKSSSPSKYPLPPESATKSQKLDYLMCISTAIVDEYIFQNSHVEELVSSVLTEQEREDLINQQELTEDGRFPCRFQECDKSFKYDGKSRRSHELTHDPPPDIQEQPIVSSTSSKPKSPPKKDDTNNDDVFNYNCALLQDGFLFINFLDAIAEGDGPRIIRQYKYILLYCKADGTHSTKYALECLYQFFLVHALLSPRDSERFIWNRSVNNGCKRGTNIPLDLDVEHSNNFIKQAIKNLGPNVTENAISRISNSESATRAIIAKVDDTIIRTARSGRHTHSSAETDLEELLKRALDVDIFTQQEQRNYKHYSVFQRDRLGNLNMSDVYKWLNKHKKNITLGIRAR